MRSVHIKGIGLGLVLAAILIHSNAHLFLFQVAAWSRMLTIYVQEDGWVTGTRATFDGSRPCKYCEIVQKAAARQAPAKELVAPTVGLPELILADSGWVPALPGGHRGRDLPLFMLHPQYHPEPPSPPPRAMPSQPTA